MIIRKLMALFEDQFFFSSRNWEEWRIFFYMNLTLHRMTTELTLREIKDALHYFISIRPLCKRSRE
jgi:hypothetical protein